MAEKIETEADLKVQLGKIMVRVNLLMDQIDEKDETITILEDTNRHLMTRRHSRGPSRGTRDTEALTAASSQETDVLTERRPMRNTPPRPRRDSSVSRKPRSARRDSSVSRKPRSVSRSRNMKDFEEELASNIAASFDEQCKVEVDQENAHPLEYKVEVDQENAHPREVML